jgi:glutathione S-transferase
MPDRAHDIAPLSIGRRQTFDVAIMKLYDARPSVSPRRVRMFLAEKGLRIPTVQVNLQAGEHRSEAFARINPWLTVPVLEFDDGTRIHESTAICRYFEECYPEPPLMGMNARDKAIVTMWDRHMEFDGIMAVMDVFRNSVERLRNHALTGRHQVKQLPELAERGRMRFGWFLEDLDKRLSESEFVAGQRFTVADITALAAVDFGTRAKLSRPDRLKHLARWYKAVSSRPSASA